MNAPYPHTSPWLAPNSCLAQWQDFYFLFLLLTPLVAEAQGSGHNRRQTQGLDDFQTEAIPLLNFTD